VRLVRVGHVGWVSLNVNRSVWDWLQSPQRAGGRLDLRVVVSDARSRTPLNPFDVFQAPNCSAAHQPSHRGINYFSVPAPSPGWGPRGQGPSKYRQGPAKITGLIMFHMGCQIKILVFWGIFGIKKSKMTKWQPYVP